MIDPKAVIAQVNQGNYPTNWRVYCGTGDSTWVIIWCIGAGCFFLFGIVGLSAMNVGWLLFFGIPCAACILAARVARENVKAIDRSILVLLPEGVVQCYAGDPRRVSWLYFPGIHRIELARETKIGGIDGDISSRTDYWLDIYGRDGSYREWEISDCFGDTAYMYKTVIAAYNHYCYYNQFIL